MKEGRNETDVVRKLTVFILLLSGAAFTCLDLNSLKSRKTRMEKRHEMGEEEGFRKSQDGRFL